MEKLKKHKTLWGCLLIVLLLLLILQPVFQWCRPRKLIQDPADVILWKGYGPASIRYYSEREGLIVLSEGKHYTKEQLMDILADSRRVLRLDKKKADPLEPEPTNRFTFNFHENDERYYLSLWPKGNTVSFKNSHVSKWHWELDNGDEVYARLMALFEDVLPA